MEAQTFTPALVRDAVSGDAALTRKMIAVLIPVVRVRVARTLHRFRSRARGRTLEQESDDLTQEVFVQLFADGGKVLASWDPSRGMSLTSFVSLVADRATTQSLMGRARNPWNDDPSEDDALDLPMEESLGAEARLASRDGAERLYDALRAELSPLGFRVFDLLFLKDTDVDVACTELGMTADAVYAWRSRIAKTVKRLAKELDVDTSGE